MLLIHVFHVLAHVCAQIVKWLHDEDFKCYSVRNARMTVTLLCLPKSYMQPHSYLPFDKRHFKRCHCCYPRPSLGQTQQPLNGSFLKFSRPSPHTSSRNLFKSELTFLPQVVQRFPIVLRVNSSLLTSPSKTLEDLAVSSLFPAELLFSSLILSAFLSAP